MSEYREIVFTVPTDAKEPFFALLYDAGAPGFEERDAGTIHKLELGTTQVVVWLEPSAVAPFLDAVRAGAERLPEILVAASAPSAERDRHEDEWRDVWKQFFKVRRIGRIVLIPSWEDASLQPGEIALHIDPGRAFGTGGHASTRLVLRALDELDRQGALASARLLDAGCGSGILSIAAALASPTLRGIGVDIDPEAAETSRENAALNRVDDRMHYATTPIAEVPGPFEIIVANIQPEVLIPLARTFVDKLAPAGVLLLSGILDEAAPEVIAAYDAQPLERLVSDPFAAVEEDWRLLTYRKRQARP